LSTSHHPRSFLAGLDNKMYEKYTNIQNLPPQLGGKKSHIYLLIPCGTSLQTLSRYPHIMEPSKLYNAREQLKQAEFEDGTPGNGSNGKKSKSRRRRNNRKGAPLRGGQLPAVDEPEEQAVVPVVAMEDDVLVMPGQNYAVVCFVDKRDYTGTCEGASDEVGSPLNLIKIRGVFPSHERAAARVKDLMVTDGYFDMHIIKCGTWTTIGAGNGDDVTYENEGVQDIMQSFFKNHYLDIASMKSRISEAKKAGMADLEHPDPKKFYDAAQTVGEGMHPLPTLPVGAQRMSAGKAVAALQAPAAQLSEETGKPDWQDTYLESDED
jgi:hypothetical protein